MTACGYCFSCLEYCSSYMECYARLNTRITKPHEAQEKGQQLGKTGTQYANLWGYFIV